MKSIDLSNYTIDQLVELQSKVNNLISDYSDGHIYICKIKSYGRNSTNKNIRNTKTLQDLCNEYNGDNGIVDVFTTNKDLGEDFSNYGDTMIIKSLEDYQKWSKYKSLSNEIENGEQHLIEYEEDQKKSFYDQQFRFGPYYTGEVIDQMKEELKALPTDFEEPTLHRRESR
jgi:hypothetical protein